MNETKFWTTISKDEHAKPACLIVMVSMEGSGPNRPGSKMCVFADGTTIGTVGGGAAEYILVEKAKKFLVDKKNQKPKLIALNHDGGKTPETSGMICDGAQTYVLVVLGKKEEKKIELFLENKGVGVLEITNKGIDLIVGANPCVRPNIERAVTWDRPYVENKEGNWLYRETLGIASNVFIIGGGHCALALSPLLSTLNFHVTVLDNRKELATLKQNTAAHEIKIVDYNQVAEFVPEGDNHYAIIMTFGHKHDELVLEKLIGRRYKYLGMMGSKSKVTEVFNNLKSRGVPEKCIKKVHAPIGLPINSNTPEEIAVSIAAEMIKERNAYE